MKFGSRNQLAFCCPGLSTEWTPIEKYYKSYVYSSRQKLFFCVKDDVYDSFSLDALDLGDPQSPRLITMGVSFDSDNYPGAAESDNDVKYLCDFEKGLVINEQSDELFVVNRSIMSRMDGDGNYVEDVYYGPERGFDNSYPYKTIAFDVHKYDPETGSLRYMDRSLDGLAFFTVLNDGFALSAADFPGLKPDSIYFTDVYSPPGLWPDDMTYGGHDLGIFNYQDASFSPCYYPCDVRSIKRIDPALVWFTPTPL